MIIINWSWLHSHPLRGSVVSNSHKKTMRTGVRWLHPPSIKFRFNYDGSSRGNPSKYGIGVVISNFDAKIL